MSGRENVGRNLCFHFNLFLSKNSENERREIVQTFHGLRKEQMKNIGK